MPNQIQNSNPTCAQIAVGKHGDIKSFQVP